VAVVDGHKRGFRTYKNKVKNAAGSRRIGEGRSPGTNVLGSKILDELPVKSFGKVPSSPFNPSQKIKPPKKKKKYRPCGRQEGPQTPLPSPAVLKTRGVSTQTVATLRHMPLTHKK